MRDLKAQLIRLGSERPELRKHLRPVLDTLKTSNISMTSTLNDQIDRFLQQTTQLTLQWLLDTGAVTDGEMVTDTSFFVTFRDKGDVRVTLTYQPSQSHILVTYHPLDRDDLNPKEQTYHGNVTLEDLRFEISQDTYSSVDLRY